MKRKWKRKKERKENDVVSMKNEKESRKRKEKKRENMKKWSMSTCRKRWGMKMACWWKVSCRREKACIRVVKSGDEKEKCKNKNNVVMKNEKDGVKSEK